MAIKVVESWLLKLSVNKEYDINLRQDFNLVGNGVYSSKQNM